MTGSRSRLLVTVDEARQLLVASATALLEHAGGDVADGDLRAMLWGAGPLDDDGDVRHRRRAARHRVLLDQIIELGHQAIAVDELDGFCSAYLDDTALR